jgi:hypothetical protein
MNMNEDRLTQLINDFNPKNLTLFLRDKCINYAEVPQPLPQYDGEKFSGFQKIGEIKFENSDRLVVVASKVGSDLSERSGKKAQYDKAKKILKELTVYNAGFFIYYDTSGNFRFSLVYAQYEGTKVNFNNFRRFTYFVDKQQTNNTFKIRVGGCDFTSLEKIKDAFSVEKVNKEFYAEIAKYYYRLTDKAKKELMLPSVGENDGSKYEEFAVRLIGRIIFCWFLKHKTSSSGIPLIPPKVLSSAAVDINKEYYHLVLEKLFFEVMNKQHKNRLPDIAFYIPEHEHIPFLNGGLFEAHNNDFYKGTVNNNLKISPLWFKEFFALLERYNFTIDENSTVDAEVSVDPEMLGRIFENLLAEIVPETGETARKATGSYYTPRVIVDYMVEQSLKQYLITKTGLSEDIIDSLLSYEVDAVNINDNERTVILKALKEIKVIDPACGSGAFPMGILHRILLVLEKADRDLAIWRKLYLNTYHPVMRKIIEDKLSKGNEQYIRKLTIIQDSIYGVDIQPIAVEIAKLRCFLSLVVDEIVVDNEENRGIEALPNLEFKFVAANTLIGLPAKVNDFGSYDTADLLGKLKDIREKYLNNEDGNKNQLKTEFITIQKQLRDKIDWAIPISQQKMLTEWDPFSYEACSWFDPDWMFGVEDGFAIVIANPPYLKHESLKEKDYYKKYYVTYNGMADIYTYFIERGFNILHKNGVLAYIVSNRFTHTNYGNSLRQFLSKKNLLNIINMNGIAVFEYANVDTLILIASNSHSGESDVLVCNVEQSIKDDEIVKYIADNKDYCTRGYFSENAWSFSTNIVHRIRSKIETNNKGLSKIKNVQINRGITTGLNSVFIIGDKEKDEILIKDPSSAQIIKPIAKGEHIKRWHLKQIHSYLIFTHTGVDINKYKGILEYLSNYKYDLGNVWEAKHAKKQWYELRGCNYYSEFKKEKIIYTRLSNINSFAISTGGEFCVDSAGIIVTDDNKYYCAILNSTLILFYFKLVSVIWGKDGIKWFGNSFDNIPIHEIDYSKPIEIFIHNQIIIAVDNILSITKDADYLSNPAKKAKVADLEREIDELVYKLYELTPEEIAIVEGNRK